MKTIILAHYYTIPEVQEMADFVGDSLDLSLAARDAKADRIVFAGVRFMAETAKILNPDAEVILPDAGSSCSLVKETDISELAAWVGDAPYAKHVAYINSSVEHKALADWIVTSRNVEPIIEHILAEGSSQVLFSPDYNMGHYLNKTNNWNMSVWHATCEVHEKFNVKALEAEYIKIEYRPAGGNPILIAHPESTLSVLDMADMVGSTSKMLKFIEDFDGSTSASVIFVATEDGILYNMRKARPDLDIRQAPIYSGCQCNSCPYMKLNTVEQVTNAVRGLGTVIDYISDDLREKALIPLTRMLDFSERNKI